MKLVDKIKLIDIYLMTSFINVGAVVISLFATNGQFLSEVVWDARHPLFIDFASCEGNHGTNNSGYFFFYLIGRLIPDGKIANSDVNDWYNLFCIIGIAICVSIMVLTINEWMIVSKSFLRRILFVLAFIMSQPFSFALIKAGNTIYVSLTALILAVFLKDKKNGFCRELALLCIVLAADLKLAPAIFGLIYIKEKRYKEAIRLLVYGIVGIVVIPSFYGIIQKLIAELTEYSSVYNPRPETIIGVVIELGILLGVKSSVYTIIAKVCAYVYLVVVIILFLLGDYSWRTLFLLTSTLVVFLNGSYPYTLCYFIIPLAFFVREENRKSLLNCIYAVLFALIFSAYPLIRIEWPTATFITNYFFLYLMIAVILVDVVKSIVVKKKEANLCG